MEHNDTATNQQPLSFLLNDTQLYDDKYESFSEADVSANIELITEIM